MNFGSLRSGTHVLLRVGDGESVLGEPLALCVEIGDEEEGRVRAADVEVLYVRRDPGDDVRTVVVARRSLPRDAEDGGVANGSYEVAFELPAEAPPTRRGVVDWLARAVLQRRGERPLEKRVPLAVRPT
jgi:hypothetical protein